MSLLLAKAATVYSICDHSEPTGILGPKVPYQDWKHTWLLKYLMAKSFTCTFWHGLVLGKMASNV